MPGPACSVGIGSVDVTGNLVMARRRREAIVPHCRERNAASVLNRSKCSAMTMLVAHG